MNLIFRIRLAQRLILSVFAITASGCGPKAAPSSVAAPVQVQVQVIQKVPLQDVVELDGSVAASRSVDLVARVPGLLTGIRFADGSPVRAGQTLFTIERDTYEEQVRLNDARLSQARSDDNRQRQLLAENATSQASVDSSRANLKQAQANLALAQINLGYTEVRAPFDGVMGRHQVDVGNYVGSAPTGTLLGTILKISPAYVNAAIGEREALQLRDHADQAALPRTAPNGARTAPALRVRARLQGEAGTGEVGTLDFVDRQFASVSGTLGVRAIFPNVDRHLIPGSYAHLVVELGNAHEAIVLPADVVRSDPQGEYVMVVDGRSVAHRRAVRTRSIPEQRKEILEGVVPGESVIVAGYASASDGMPVRIRTTSSGTGALKS